MSSNAWIIIFALMLFHQGSALFLDPNCGIVSNPLYGRTYPTPWLAQITTNKQKCSGVLIHRQYVITAARCLKNANQTIVRFGDFGGSQQNQNTADFPYEEYDVQTAIINYLYNEAEHVNNLALLKLREKVTYKPHIQPICILLQRNFKAHVDTTKEFSATLWGLSEMTPFQEPRTDTITRLSATECSAIFQAPPESSDICASFTSGANCLEMGSPLGNPIMNGATQRYILYGIQSYGTSKTCVFTDIMSYVDWILQNVLEVSIHFDISKN